MAVFDVNNLIIVIILAEVQCFVKDLFLKKKTKNKKSKSLLSYHFVYSKTIYFTRWIEKMP